MLYSKISFTADQIRDNAKEFCFDIDKTETYCC